MGRSDDIRLDLVEFRLLRELFNEHCGILFGAESRLVVERRLRDRLAALGLSSFNEYYQLLRFDERGRAELEEAIDLVTINETYFLREAYQLRAYKDEILTALHFRPSYIALGAVFPTTTKVMPTAPQGLARLARYVRLLDGVVPLVAIGGIDQQVLPQVLATGVGCAAVVRAVTEAADPAAAVSAMQRGFTP